MTVGVQIGLAILAAVSLGGFIFAIVIFIRHDIGARPSKEDWLQKHRFDGFIVEPLEGGPGLIIVRRQGYRDTMIGTETQDRQRLLEEARKRIVQ